MGFVFQRQLKGIKQLYLASKKNDEKYERIIDNLIEKFGSSDYDRLINNFIVNKIANLSDELKDGEASIEDLENAAAFLGLFEETSYEEVMDSRVYNNLSELYEHYLELGGSEAINKIADEIQGEDSLLNKMHSDKISSRVKNKMKIPDAISYLPLIQDLDEFVHPRENDKVYVSNVLSKLKTIVDVMSDLETRWGFEFEEKRINKEHYTEYAERIDKIQGWIGSNATKTKTKGIYEKTRIVREVCNPLSDLRSQLKSIEGSIKHPELLMDDKSIDSLEQEKSKLLIKIRKLEGKKDSVLREYVKSSDYQDYKKLLKNLDETINRDIIGPLNDLVRDIRVLFNKEYGQGKEFLIIREDILKKAEEIGISLDSILKESEEKIADLDYFIDLNKKAHHKQFKYYEDIKRLIKRRVKEELSLFSDQALNDYLSSKEKGLEPIVNSEGILSITNQFLEEVFQNNNVKLRAKGSMDKRGYGLIPVKCMFDDYITDSLNEIKKCVEKIDMKIAASKIPDNIIKGLEDKLEISDITDLTISRIKEIIRLDALPPSYKQQLNKLLKQYPLTKKDYEQVKHLRDNIKEKIGEFDVMGIARETMLTISKKMELLDTSLPRKFAAISDIRLPSLFSQQLDEWLNNNQSRLYQQGHQKKIAEARREIGVIKKLLNRLEVIINKLPPGITDNIKSFPLQD